MTQASATTEELARASSAIASTLAELAGNLETTATAARDRYAAVNRCVHC